MNGFIVAMFACTISLIFFLLGNRSRNKYVWKPFYQVLSINTGISAFLLFLLSAVEFSFLSN